MFKRAVAASIALLSMNGAAWAQFSTGPACQLPSVADAVALEQLPGTALMTVPVAINGTTKHFLLDIGTNPSEVSQAAVTDLGLPQDVKLTEGISGQKGLTNGSLSGVSVVDVRDKIGAGGAQTRVRIASFTLGKATTKSLMFLVANDAEMGKPGTEPYDGLLTGDFFKQYDIELDFAGKQINWLTPTKCTDPLQVVFWSHYEVGVIPMTIADGKIQVPVTAGGHAINAVIDTSSPRTIVRRDIAELVFGLKADTPDMTPAGDLKDGKGETVYVHNFSQIAFAGGVVAQNVPALIQANSLTHEITSGAALGSHASSAEPRIPDMTLGMDVLQKLHMYIVPGQGKVYVTSVQF
jgi:Aspartyl protease